MLQNIKFKDKYLSEFGCVILEPPTRSFPVREVEEVEVPGRSGNLIIDKKRFKNISVTYKISTVPTLMEYSFDETITRLKKWLLSSVEYGKLEDTELLNGFYMAYCSEISNPVTDFDDVAEFNITFNCKPLFYINYGQKVITHTETYFNLFNPGTYTALPKIRLYGSGPITVAVNNTSFQIFNVDEYVDIDSESRLCCKDTINKIADFCGVFPCFDIGNNNINIVGDCSKIEIFPRWCNL